MAKYLQTRSRKERTPSPNKKRTPQRRPGQSSPRKGRRPTPGRGVQDSFAAGDESIITISPPLSSTAAGPNTFVHRAMVHRSDSMTPPLNNNLRTFQLASNSAAVSGPSPVALFSSTSAKLLAAKRSRSPEKCTPVKSQASSNLQVLMNYRLNIPQPSMQIIPDELNTTPTSSAGAARKRKAGARGKRSTPQVTPEVTDDSIIIVGPESHAVDRKGRALKRSPTSRTLPEDTSHSRPKRIKAKVTSYNEDNALDSNSDISELSSTGRATRGAKQGVSPQLLEQNTPKKGASAQASLSDKALKEIATNRQPIVALSKMGNNSVQSEVKAESSMAELNSSSESVKISSPPFSDISKKERQLLEKKKAERGRKMSPLRMKPVVVLERLGDVIEKKAEPIPFKRRLSATELAEKRALLAEAWELQRGGKIGRRKRKRGPGSRGSKGSDIDSLSSCSSEPALSRQASVERGSGFSKADQLADIETFDLEADDDRFAPAKAAVEDLLGDDSSALFPDHVDDEVQDVLPDNNDVVPESTKSNGNVKALSQDDIIDIAYGKPVQNGVDDGLDIVPIIVDSDKVNGDALDQVLV